MLCLWLLEKKNTMLIYILKYFYFFFNKQILLVYDPCYDLQILGIKKGRQRNEYLINLQFVLIYNIFIRHGFPII